MILFSLVGIVIYCNLLLILWRYCVMMKQHSCCAHLTSLSLWCKTKNIMTDHCLFHLSAISMDGIPDPAILKTQNLNKRLLWRSWSGNDLTNWIGWQKCGSNSYCYIKACPPGIMLFPTLSTTARLWKRFEYCQHHFKVNWMENIWIM